MTETIKEIMKRVFNMTSLPEIPSQQNVEQWDSLHHLNLMIELEMELGIEFSPEEIVEMKDIQEIERVIKRRK